MSTIEKLFVQIFDRKRQIVEQLNHQKQLYDQNLASKLLIQGITPPPWLLNSDKFASSSASSSDPKDLNKEELISGLLLPCPQPVPSYCNATHMYGKQLSTVGNGELEHDLFIATSAGGKGLDDCRPGVLPQCLFRGLEDAHNHVAESPQERVASDIYADLDQSLARMQRSKSRQKAFELRSSTKVSAKCQLEDNTPTGPRRQDAFKEESATTSGVVLSSSKDVSLVKKQDVSSKEEGDFRCTANETDAPTNMLSLHSHCRDLSVEESLVAANSVCSEEGMSVHLLKKSVVGIYESCDRKCANSNLFKDELMESQGLSREEDISTSKSKCDNAQNTEDAERLVAIELPENTIDRAEFVEGLRRSASLGAPLSRFHASYNSDRKMNVCHSAPVGILEQTKLRNTLALSDINGQLLMGDFRCTAIETDAPTSLLSPHSDCRDLSVEESLVAADSFSRKGGISAPVRVLEQTNRRNASALSDITGQLLKGDFRCTAIETDAPTNLLSPHSDCRDLFVEESLVAADSVSSKGGIFAPVGVLEQTNLRNTSAFSDITGQQLKGDFRCTAVETDSPTNLLSPHRDCRDLSVEESLVAADRISSKGEISAPIGVLEQTNLRNTSALSDITGQLLEGDFRCSAIEIDAPTNLLSPHSDFQDLSVEESLVAANSVSSNGGISRHLLKESVVVDELCDRKCANSNLLTENLMENQGLSIEEDISVCRTKELDASSDLLSPEEHIAQPELEQPNSPSERVNRATNSFGKHKVLGETPAEGALVDNLLHMVGGQALKLSSAKLTNELDLENYGGLCSGKASRESQRRYEASTDQCKTAAAFKLATANSEDNMKHASVRQKLDDAHPQAAELQATCFSKEDKCSVSPKLLELQTLSIESSPTYAMGGSWPQQKRRKIESIISKSANPHLRVNPSSFFSHGVYVDKSCTGDFSATKITQNDTSSLPEHSSKMQLKEEKLSSQGSSDVHSEKLQVYSVPCLTQQLIATPQECLHKADLSREKCDFSFYVSKVDADPADNKWRGRISSEVQNTHNCLSGSPFMEHKEAVGAERDKPDLQCFTFDKKLENAQNIGDIDVDMDDTVDDNVADILTSSQTARCHQKVKDFDCLGDSPLEHRDTVGRKFGAADLVNFTFYSKCDETRDTGDPEKLVAIDLPKNTIDRAEFLERLCRSASLGVSFCHLHGSYSSDRQEDVCHSVPVGVLEQTDLRNTSAVNDGTGQLLKASHTYTRKAENSEFQGKSFSDYSPTHGTPFAWDFKGPYMSPFEKAIEGLTAKSRSSSKRCSSNPELTCFPIEESGEEDVSADDNDHNCPEETGSVRKSSCSTSEEYMNVVAVDPASKMVRLGSVSTETSISTSNMQRSSSPEITCIPVEESSEHVNVDAAQACQETSGSARQPLRDISKRGTESFSRASNTSEINSKISQNSEAQPQQSGHLRKRKVTQNISLGTTGKKQFESRPTRFSKPKVSVKSGLETRGGSFSVKEAKPSNIVSSIKSFLPLVQQKQAASCAPVKKEVRVKALEAAEAAKRLAEKKENERNQKKEAVKLERARLEQEKLRRLELLKKAKEEERKRKEVEIAERKRKREEEEEERKEKERKRKRVGEARKQKKGHEDKMPMDKRECNSQAEDGNTDKRREDNAGTEEIVSGGLEEDRVAKNPADDQATSTVLTFASGDLELNGLGMPSGHCQKQKDFSATVAGCSTPTPDVATQTIREKSYDISPYCCSDDEDEEDELSNDKFKPAWASKSSIKMTLASLNTLDPEVIFPPSSFCSLNEVLLPRELKQQ